MSRKDVSNLEPDGLPAHALQDRGSRDAPAISLARAVRGPTLLGFTVLVVFFVGLGAWGGTATLSSAAIAPGTISPDGSRRTIQHLEGGIVRGIHVREGDHVKTGDVLLSLEDVQARAQYDELRERLSFLVAIAARLHAEQLAAEEVETPQLLAELGLAEDPEALEALRAQRLLFDSRHATFEGREQILQQRVLQLESEIAGLHEVIAAQDRQIELIGTEITNVQTLLAKGLERLPRLLALQREEADIGAERAANVGAIARKEQEIGETELQVLTMREERREQINQQFAEVRAELAGLRSQLPSRVDILQRTEVTSPLDGTVMNVRVTTKTGVVRPGEPLLDLVPADEKLIIDARVQPVDIDNVAPGMHAKVVLSAFTQRNLPQIHGTVRSISADALVDERTGAHYFLAKVEVDPDELARYGDEFTLYPGMPAEVFLLTGERTLLDYLVKPFVDSVRKSFREA